MSESSKKILSFYDEHIDTYGFGPRAVGWGDAHSQEVRFAALCTIGDLNGTSILDVGCGLGDLYSYLSKRYTGITYAGIDINPRYVERAQELHPDAYFEVADSAEYDGKMVDYVFASGAFAVKIPDHKMVYFESIKKMFGLARKGIAFNMLDQAHHPDDEEYAAYGIDEVREFCLSFTNDVTILHEYLPHDFTVIMRKNG